MACACGPMKRTENINNTPVIERRPTAEVCPEVKAVRMVEGLGNCQELTPALG